MEFSMKSNLEAHMSGWDIQEMLPYYTCLADICKKLKSLD